MKAISSFSGMSPKTRDGHAYGKRNEKKYRWKIQLAASYEPRSMLQAMDKVYKHGAD